MIKKWTWRIWLLVICLALSLISIFGIPPMFLKTGVMISHVESNSIAFEQGLKVGQIIKYIDGNKIKSLNDYTEIMHEKSLNEYSKTEIILDSKEEFIFYTNSSIGITVKKVPKTNINIGLDLAGGSKALVKAENASLTVEETRDLSNIISNRLNAYGLTEMKVSPITDLSGNNYISIEIAGANPEDLTRLISEQGKFEAKIGNETVFLGGTDEGVASVSRSGSDSGIYQCLPNGNEYYCNFRFGLYLTEKAAKNQAEITSKLNINATNPGYLEKSLDLYLDDKLVNSLFISKELKGSSTPQISISGSGSGSTKDVAIKNAGNEMKQLQTVLVTGSLPYKLEIIKLDTISPTLGEDFIKITIIAAIISIIAVFIVVLIRYKNTKYSFALILTTIAEMLIFLGISAFVGISLDLPAIAGMIAGVGTGIDSEVIILDESKQKVVLTLKQKLKRAFGILMGSYAASVVSMLPLIWAAAGMFKGFAITSIIQLTVGIAITRTAFIEMVRVISEKENVA